MAISDVNPRHALDVDAQLQEELQSLFIVDTQHYLQRYGQIVHSLQTQSWRTDVQELYRCIHTIKGEAVTVGAERVLQVATALENVLSDLRYLESAPLLQDGYLNQALLEAGDLLTATVDPEQQGEVEPILNHIQTLRAEIRNRYLPQWTETKQLHQEFADQGFDLVVLDLEVALERLPDRGLVDDLTQQTAQQTLVQLQQIGQELRFASGWTELLQRSQDLLDQPVNHVWRSQWLPLFQALKDCAKQGGKPVPFEAIAPPIVESLTNANSDEDLVSLPDIGSFLDECSQTQGFTAFEDDDSDVEYAIAGNTAIDNTIVDKTADDTIVDTTVDTTVIDKTDIDNTVVDTTADDAIADDLLPDLDQVQFWLDQTTQDSFFVESFTLAPEQDQFNSSDSAVDLLALQAIAHPVEQPELSEPAQSKPEQVQPEQSVKKPANVKVPVPLEKLDQSAQQLVETLLSLRTTQGVYQVLQTQISQLVNLAQESAQYITHLRQIQDDYALLNQLQNSTQAEQGPTPERYRQGYTIINRLLETSLRLSEIGAETGKTSQQITDYLRTVDRNVLKLQTTIEDSRLILFQNLGLRARAILRDLTTRYGKPARLVVQGEQTELDIGTARDLEPAILHLIRNAYDHGLETAEQRLAQGKPEQGTITLSLQRRGNLFQLELRDDGRGIDAEAVQAKAEALGLPLTVGQTPSDLLAVICQPGFSSQSQVTAVSGRGIGMDVVAAQVARLGGRLSLQTTPGRETVFHLQVPVPRLLVPCVLLRLKNVVVAIPEDDIKTAILFSNVSASPVQDAASSYTWTIQDETGDVPVFDLLNYWQPQSSDRHRSPTDTTVCLSIYTDDAQNSIWFLADELLEQSDLIINPLPTPLITPDGLIGVSLQANGSLVPVLEARRLAERLLTSPTQVFGTASITLSESDVWDEETPHPILIVDDAALMRRRLEASLNAYGHPTHCCADGQEAWNWLQTHTYPSMVITDIEMPNMDGFTLIDRCRQTGITIPILVISSRLSEEWSDEAKRLGASDYLTKGFSTIELIKKVNLLLLLDESLD